MFKVTPENKIADNVHLKIVYHSAGFFVSSVTAKMKFIIDNVRTKYDV